MSCLSVRGTGKSDWLTAFIFFDVCRQFYFSLFFLLLLGFLLLSILKHGGAWEWRSIIILIILKYELAHGRCMEEHEHGGAFFFIIIIFFFYFFIFFLMFFLVYGPLCHPAFNAGNRPTSLLILIVLFSPVSVSLSVCVSVEKKCVEMNLIGWRVLFSLKRDGRLLNIM